MQIIFWKKRKNKISKIIIPKTIQEQTINHIRQCGENLEEGFVAWSGTTNKTHTVINSVIIPSADGFRHYGGIHFSNETVESIADSILKKGEKLIAQVHSHPFEAFHSITDNSYPLVHREGFLSIVIPFFGRGGFAYHDGVRAFEYQENCKWDEISSLEFQERFKFQKRKIWKTTT